MEGMGVGRWGHRGVDVAWRRAAFLFHVFSAVKNENKESSTVFF